jgi:hypothetical protein
MTYTVVPAEQKVLDELMALLNRSTPVQRGRISRAVNKVDKHLKYDAHQKGQVITTSPEEIRFLRETPLEVRFTVSQADRLVKILEYRNPEDRG